MSLRLLLLALGALAGSLAAAPLDLTREMILTPPDGRAVEDREIIAWQNRCGSTAARLPDFERLGWAFVAKARVTLDPSWYKLAEATADVLERRYGKCPEAALLRGHVFHNLHRFQEAEAIGRELAATRGAPLDFALWSDALMEQGRLADAIAALQRLAAQKPGVEADARIAQIRWLKGDAAGAIRALEQACRETAPRDTETLAWLLTRLGGLHLLSGEIAPAKAVAEIVLARAPRSAPNQLLLGRIALAERRTSDAIAHLRLAADLNPLPEYLWTLADALRTTGDRPAADAIEQRLRRDGATADPRTFALFLATRRSDTDRAVTLARAELIHRADVYTHDALAWALYSAGEPEAAQAESALALAESTPDARLWLHAAVIARALGRTDEARARFAACRRGAAALLPSERQLLDAADPSLSAAAPTDSRATAVAATARAADAASRPVAQN